MRKEINVNQNQLKKQLESLENELDDVKLEKKMIFNQSGLHVSSKKVSEQIKELDEEIDKLEKKILDLREQIIE